MAALHSKADMVHLLSTVNQLNFTEEKKDAWAAVMASFQNYTLVCTSNDICPGKKEKNSTTHNYINC